MSIYDLSRSEIESLINEWILSEKGRRIMRRRLLDGLTIEALAEEVSMSPRQVHRIVKNLTIKLQEKCNKIAG
jgi:DNA-directed RNA polymerase specialized sigma subunit